MSSSVENMSKRREWPTVSHAADTLKKVKTENWPMVFMSLEVTGKLDQGVLHSVIVVKTWLEIQRFFFLKYNETWILIKN